MLTKALEKVFGLEEIIIIILLPVDNVMEVNRIAILMLEFLEMFFSSFLSVFLNAKRRNLHFQALPSSLTGFRYARLHLREF
ncbi:unnamed protein product [Citrullus colocynthis]|uniref:Uncharacterized protein n=1 Tax=Citrullus colocynthis TaxID=252529 RepID=A0ABP0YBB4_9ROSI